MMESVKDGDRIVCTNTRESNYVKRLLKDRMLDVECIVVSPDDPCRLFERAPSQGRTIFSHEWIEQFYTTLIEDGNKQIDYLQRRANESHTNPRREDDRLAEKQHSNWTL
jgi:hypothetical protein